MLTPEDLAQIRTIVRAELASVALRSPADAPHETDAGLSALRAFLARKRLVTAQEAAGAMFGILETDVGASDVKHAAGALRALGWQRFKVIRAGVRGWYYRRPAPPIPAPPPSSP